MFIFVVSDIFCWCFVLRFVFLVLFSLLLVLGLVCPVLGQMMHEGIGVADGDTFSYSYLCYFDSDDPSFSMPADSLGLIKQTFTW
jgi:hypothetical protein